MDCRQVRDLLFESVDSDLPEVVREDMEAHLAQCRSCAAMAAAVEAELEALKALNRVTAPADFLQGIHARLNESEPLKRREKTGAGLFGGRRFIEAAGLAVAAMLVVVIYQASLRGTPQVKPLLSEQPVPVSRAKPEVESLSPPAERSVIRDEMERSAAGLQQPASPQARVGDSGESLAPGHWSMTLTLKPPSSPSADSGDKKGSVAPPLHRHSGQTALRAALPAATGGEGQAGGREGERREDGEVEFGRADESVSSELRGVREKAAMPPAPEPSHGRRIQSAVDEIGRIVVECGGTLLSPLPRYPMNGREAMVTAEVPSDNLPALLDRLRLLGEARSDEVIQAPVEAGTRIRVSLKLIVPES